MNNTTMTDSPIFSDPTYTEEAEFIDDPYLGVGKKPLIKKKTLTCSELDKILGFDS